MATEGLSKMLNESKSLIPIALQALFLKSITESKKYKHTADKAVCLYKNAT